jgi:hypothetical protein
MTWLKGLIALEHRVRNLERTRAADPDDAERAASGRSRYGNDCVVDGKHGGSWYQTTTIIFSPR